MATTTHYTFFLLLTLSAPHIQCATYENVTILLTTRYSVYYINDTIAPIKPVRIRSDNTLVEYVNNQPWEIVKIENQSVPILPPDSVSRLYNVSEINISSSGVKDIHPGAFRNLPSLEFLYINGNPLDEVKDDVFANLTQLAWLHLEDNKISKLGDRAFNDLPNLKHVFMDRNRISVWKSNWFVGSPVESISMESNSVEELPKDMFEYLLKFRVEDGPVSLWYLVMGNNKVKNIHPDAFRGVNELLYLNLQNNSIEELPNDVFRTVRYINNFELSNNLIHEIDVSKVFKNTELTYVKLGNNKLNCIPVEIVNLTKIFSLNIDGNPVSCSCVEKWKKEFDGRILSLEKIERNCIE